MLKNLTGQFKRPFSLTTKILIGMLAGMIVGLIINFLPESKFLNSIVTGGILDAGGKIFLTIMKMLVVPVVFISLVCGTCSLGNVKKLGRLGLKTFLLYIFTTALAITLGLSFATLFGIGHNAQLGASHLAPVTTTPLSFKDIIINLFPTNPIKAMAEGNMLQVIVFSILLGMAISFAGEAGRKISEFFTNLNEVIMKMVLMLIKVAPYGIFCLIGHLFAKLGFGIIKQLISYFLVVLFVLFIHVLLSNSIILQLFARLNPIIFFRKMYSAMMFAFSTSSSSVSIPVVLNTVEHKLGVKNSVASFIIPLGATINMDGTAIMQGVATVFIAHAYAIKLSLMTYLTIILTATLASIGTAGVPGVGLITLIMVLQQANIPVAGISLIIGVDRILDMARTAVNIAGDSAIACFVAKTENAIDQSIYNNPSVNEETPLTKP